MLPSNQRLRANRDIRETLRSGVKAARPSLVVHARLRPVKPSRAGFVVSKAVGNAVVRNRVKRQLRHLMAPQLLTSPNPVDVVVRALPAAATATGLFGDLDAALTRCYARLPR